MSFQAEVRRLFKTWIGIAQDIDFMAHVLALKADVHAYEYEDGPGPDKDAIAFDLSHNYSIPWNMFILELFL